jgi:hypothetical protein
MIMTKSSIHVSLPYISFKTLILRFTPQCPSSAHHTHRRVPSPHTTLPQTPTHPPSSPPQQQQPHPPSIQATSPRPTTASQPTTSTRSTVTLASHPASPSPIPMPVFTQKKRVQSVARFGTTPSRNPSSHPTNCEPPDLPRPFTISFLRVCHPL